MNGSVAAVVAMAVLAGAGPRGRPVGHVARRPGRRGGRRAGRGAVRQPGLVAVVAQASGQLRAGASPAAAWTAALGMPVGASGPSVGDLVAVGSGAGRRVTPVGGVGDRRPGITRAAARRGRRADPSLEHRAATVVAATRLAGRLGTPLAPVLDRVVEALAADEEVDGERRAALAGPRSTARLLAWLPVLGVPLAAAVGADPVRVVLDGGAGTAAVSAGVVLVVAGRAWSNRLVRTAADA